MGKSEPRPPNNYYMALWWKPSDGILKARADQELDARSRPWYPMAEGINKQVVELTERRQDSMNI